MKILHVIDSGGLYGAENMLLSLAEEQQRLGMRPTILSIGTPDAGEKPIEIQARRRGLSVQPWRMRAGLNLLGGYRISRIAYDGGFDVLHSHGYKGNILLGILPRRVRRLPLVSTLHGWTSLASLSRMAMNQWLDRRMLRRADAVVVVNSLMLQDPRVVGLGAQNIRSVNNGISVDGNVVPGVDANIRQFCKHGFIVGAVGRLSPEKGFDVLIQALAMLALERADVKAVILGEGPCREELEKQIIDAGLSGKVLLPGYRHDAMAYMHEFDIFVLPSLTEGLPITLLEAMACKTPVVATRVGGVSEVLADGACGSIVDPGKPVELAEAIRKYCNGKIPVEDITKSAYQRVTDHYSSAQMAREYLEVYHDVATNIPGNSL